MDEIINHFIEAIDKAVNDHVDAILISGDLFESYRVKYIVLKKIMDALREPYEKGIRIYCILGDHDQPRVRDIPPQALIPYMKVLGTRTTPLTDCFMKDGREYCIAGVSNYRIRISEKQKQKLLENIRKAMNLTRGRTILMLHQNISNFFKFEPGLGLDELPEKPFYIAMGHLHWRIKYWRDNQLIAYPGSLDILDVSEYEYWRKYGKGFYYVDLSGDQPEIQEVDITPISMEKIKADTSNLRERIVEAVNKLPRDKKSILYIEIELSTSEKGKVDHILNEYAKKYRGRIYFRENMIYKDVKIEFERETSSIDDLSMDVITEILGGVKYRDLAEKILLLKQALLEEDNETIDKLIDEIAKADLWDKYIPREYIKLPITSITETPKTMIGKDLKKIKPLRRTGKIDITKFFGG